MDLVLSLTWARLSLFKDPPQKELKERTLVYTLKLKTEQARSQWSAPPSMEKDGGEQGRGWSSGDALEIYHGKRLEATWGLLVDVHQLGALPLHHPDIRRCMHYPKQLSEGRFQVIDKPISYLPAWERDHQLPAVLLLHPPAWQPFPCNSTITIRVTSESWTDSKPSLVKRAGYTELHLKSPGSFSWGSSRYQNKVKIKYNYCLAQCVFSTGITLVALQLGNVTTLTELHFNYQGEKTTLNPTTDNAVKAKQTEALILQRLMCMYMLNFTLSQDNYLCCFSSYDVFGK